MTLLERVRRRPVIAAVKELGALEAGLAAGVEVFFVQGGDVFGLVELAARLDAAGRLVLAHVDLVKGVGRDAEGLAFLARHARIHGVITTKAALVAAARKEGLFTVLRLFALDSHSLETGLPVLRQAQADAVEILPGPVVPLVLDRLRAAGLPPVIAGGLITEPAQVRQILAAGATAVSTSTRSLFGLAR